MKIYIIIRFFNILTAHNVLKKTVYLTSLSVNLR